MKTWTIKESLRVAGLPASVYAIQNIFYLKGAQNIDGLTFNLINQTKSVSAAIFLFFVMGKQQSLQQVFALCLLFSVGVVISLDNENTGSQPYVDMQYNLGITCCLSNFSFHFKPGLLKLGDLKKLLSKKNVYYVRRHKKGSGVFS